MTDYQPVSLDALCNAGVEALADLTHEPPLGRQSLQGLPFQVGAPEPRPERCFLRCSAADGAMTVPIGRACHTVIVAHAVLDSQLMAGGPLGRPVATYAFRVASGRHTAGGAASDDAVHEVAIRERFEIAAPVPDRAYLGVDDPGQRLWPRYEGRWEYAGSRQAEVTRGPVTYTLWAWRNPVPEQVVEELQVAPSVGGPAFIVAGVTTGHVDEHPFPRQGRREVKLTLTDPDAARRPFDLDAKVDRGIATYVHPLPAADAGSFVGDRYAGWGEAQNPASSPAYTEIAATPSATVTVEQGGSALGRVRWGDVEQRGSAADGGGPRRAAGRRPQLGARDGAGRGHRQAGAVPGALPLPGRGAVSSPTATTTRSTPTTGAGTSTWAATCAWARSPTPTSTAAARGGCRAATCWWTWRAASSISRCARGCGSSRASAS